MLIKINNKARLKQAVALAVLAVLSACSGNPYAPTNRVYKRQAKQLAQSLRQIPPVNAGQDSLNISSTWAGTTNFNLRKPNFVVIHYTAQNSVGQTLRTFTLTRTQVSAHYVVSRDGTIYHMLNDYMRAWHAGTGKWGKDADINSSSIGIELDNNGSEPFAEAQITSLLKLLGNLKQNYNIPTQNFIGHGDMAPTRKPDPGVYFPWKTLAEKGFGLWYDNTMDLPPAGFDPAIALRLIGYDTSNLNATIVAFKRHFVQSNISPVLSPSDMAILYNLSMKY